MLSFSKTRAPRPEPGSGEQQQGAPALQRYELIVVVQAKNDCSIITAAAVSSCYAHVCGHPC